MIDQYWAELEWDFQHVLGLNAMDWIAGKKDWRQFYRFKQRLGMGTAYFAAKANDPELAKELAKQPRNVNSEAKPPSVEGWTPMMDRLANIEDRLIILSGAFSGDENFNPTFVKRPEYEHEKIRKAESRKNTRRIMAQLLPHQFPQQPE